MGVVWSRAVCLGQFYIKGTPYDHINFRFYLCDEVVYPTDHAFIFFSFFRKNILFLWIGENLNKLCVYVNDLNLPTTLGHMLMPSAQRWADNKCCRCIPHVLILRHQLAAIALMCNEVGLDPIAWDVGIYGIKCCIQQIVLLTRQYTTWK